MAALFRFFAEEVRLTVDDFRQKGAVGTLRDVALDTRDMATDAGKLLWGGFQTLVNTPAEPESAVGAFIRSDELPMQGDLVMLEFADGRALEVLVIVVDGVSVPPRVKVSSHELDEPLVVNVVLPGTEEAREPDSPESPESPSPSRPSLIAALTQEWNATVDDFREKGAVGAIKDAALDAVDIVGSTTASAVNGARSLASPLINLMDLGEGSGPAAAAASDEATEPRGARAIIQGIRQDFQGTVQDIRERGAVVVMKDAAMEALWVCHLALMSGPSNNRTERSRRSRHRLTLRHQGSRLTTDLRRKSPSFLREGMSSRKPQTHKGIHTKRRS